MERVRSMVERFAVGRWLQARLAGQAAQPLSGQVRKPAVYGIGVALLLAVLGPEAPLLYMAAGAIISVIAGWILSRLSVQDRLEEVDSYDLHPSQVHLEAHPTLAQRTRYDWEAVREITSKLWPFAIGGILVGALIYSYLPVAPVAGFAIGQAWGLVPAVL